MKKTIITLITIVLTYQAIATVSYSGTYVHVESYEAGCLAKQFAKVGFFTNFELNNGQFQIQRSIHSDFQSYITVTSGFNGNFSGCGTCGNSQYEVLDYGPFAPNEVWYYRVMATSNWGVESFKELGQFTANVPTIKNWINQVSDQVITGNSPSTESSYQWNYEPMDGQGVSISLMQTEISKIYLEQNNHKINFHVLSNTPFMNLDVNINNGGYFNLYNGALTTSNIWQNSSSYIVSIGNHNLKVRFTDMSGTIYYREYDVYVVPRSNGFYVDNYCNTMRLWTGNDPSNGIPLVLSEGFDSYNTKSEQYYRQAGKDLINCLLSKGFNVYVVNYNLNAQSIKNNGAIFQSAIRYISSINGNKKVVATGMSMGGLINRFACAKAEHDGNPLPISKFVTLDAPHQGAVISKPLQDWRKTATAGDAFAEYASNNDGAKELLNYNAYDQTMHSSFFNYLNSLNGDGYPHLVEKIGVSFSTASPNPNTSGKWLYVHASGVPGYNNQDFYLTPEETVDGSVLPSVNMDPLPITSAKYSTQWLLSLLRPFSDPTVEFIQYLSPTFIPHNSSLDIINGVSKFDKIIMPLTTGYHDVIPSDIIEPIVNALLENNVYVQNKIYSNNSRIIIAKQTISAGNNVTNTLPSGIVNVNSNSSIKFKAGNEVQLLNGFSVDQNSNFTAIIEQSSCDGNDEYQTMKFAIANNTNNTNNINQSINNIEPLQSQSDFEIQQKSILENTITINEEIILFPIPTEGLLHVKIDQTNNIKYTIFNTQSVFIREDFLDNTKQINLNDLPLGMYLIKITDTITNKTKVFKVSKI